MWSINELNEKKVKFSFGGQDETYVLEEGKSFKDYLMRFLLSKGFLVKKEDGSIVAKGTFQVFERDEYDNYTEITPQNPPSVDQMAGKTYEIKRPATAA